MTLTGTIEVNGGILVAHDGSAAATAALRTAVRCRDVFGPTISVVRAWTLGTAETPASMAPGYMPSYEEFQAATLASLERDVAPIRRDEKDALISCSVVHGNAAEKLIEASSNVDLLVLGARGSGGFIGLLLGSVSEKIVRHAHCRVLVERGADSEAPPREQLESALASELRLTSAE